MQRVNIKDTGLDFGALSKRPTTDQIVIHHTGNPYDDDLSAAEIHASHRAKGWSGIGYHYVVRKDASILRERHASHTAERQSKTVQWTSEISLLR